MPLSVSMIVLGSQLAIPVADGVPKFDIVRNCKLDIAATAGLSADQSLKSCISDEQKAQQQLARQWSKFRAEPGKLRLARERRRHAKLCQPADMPQMVQWSR